MPSSNRSNSVAGTVVWWLVGTALWASLFATALVVVPAEKKKIDEMGLKVPTVTQVVIDVSMLIADWWLACVLAFVVAALIAGLITYWIRHGTDSRVLMACWILILIGVPLTLQAVTAYSFAEVL